MRYEEFRKKLENYPVFGDWVFDLIGENGKLLRNNISSWIKKGYLIRLRRGLYTMRDKDRSKQISLAYLANQIYSPSYVSLEYALQYYNFIPERVSLISSVSTKKTASFKNHYGNFSYSHIKTSAYTGFLAQQDSHGNEFLIASPEKALLDFLYFRLRKETNVSSDIFEHSYRLQNLDEIDLELLMKLCSEYQMKTMDKLALTLLEYIREEWQNV